MTNRFLMPPVFLGMLAALWLAGCVSTTQLTSVWKNPAYQTHPTKVLVVGVAKKPMKRRIFEDEFVTQLKLHGINAVASYTVLSDKKQDDQAAIADKVKELSVDAILVTRLVSKKTVKVYVPGTPYFPPPYYSHWPDYYGYGYRSLYSPGYMAEEKYALMESNLYDANKDDLIWASTSESEVGGSDQKRIKEYIGVMVKNMAENGLVNK